jgi:gamma-glutamyl:cysteine ligase YbdK (ATP-grasp superfamily)
VPAREFGERCLTDAASVAAELRCERELDYVAVMLEQGSGADLQRRVHAEGGMEGLLAYLVSETARLD